jgi:hypothetical protein
LFVVPVFYSLIAAHHEATAVLEETEPEAAPLPEAAIPAV